MKKTNSSPCFPLIVEQIVAADYATGVVQDLVVVFSWPEPAAGTSFALITRKGVGTGDTAAAKIKKTDKIQVNTSSASTAGNMVSSV